MKNQNSHPFTPMNAIAHIFYADEEKLNLSKDIPPEFEVRSLEPHHAEQMMSVLLHAQNGDEEQAA